MTATSRRLSEAIPSEYQQDMPAPRRGASKRPLTLGVSGNGLRRLAKHQGGFTLLEIMMVVIIIALLAGAAIHFMGGNIGIAQETRVKTDIQAISTQLKLYQALNGFLPSTEQGLKALMAPPTSEPRPRQWRQFFEKIPLDPWQNEYNYSTPGKRNTNSFDLSSSGNDRKAGTTDDVGNWD